MDSRRVGAIAALAALVLLLTPTVQAASGSFFDVDRPDELTLTRPERICATQPAKNATMGFQWFNQGPPTDENLTNTRSLDDEDCAWFGTDRPTGHQWLRLSYDADGNGTVHATFYFSQNGTLAHTDTQATDLQAFAGMSTTELAFFAGMAFIGVLLWSRSLDGAIRIFGAFLPITAGLLLLGFGTQQGFGSLWQGTSAFAILLMLTGLYMAIRQFYESLVGDDTDGGLFA